MIGKMMVPALLAAIAAVPAAPVFAAVTGAPVTANQKLLSDKLRAQITQVIEATPGVIGFSVIDLTDGRTIGINDELTFPTASSIKLLVDAALYRDVASGRIDLDRRYQVNLGKGRSSYSVRDISFVMIDQSSNVATNALIDIIGMDRINDLARVLGLKSIVLQRKMLDKAAGQRGEENLATPVDAARFMGKFLACDLPMPHATCAEMLAVAFKTYPSGPVRQQIPASVSVVQMPGGLAGVRNSWAAVALPDRPFAMAIMGHYGDFDNLTIAIRRITDLTYDYFRRLSGANAFGVREGATPAPVAKPK